MSMRLYEDFYVVASKDEVEKMKRSGVYKLFCIIKRVLRYSLLINTFFVFFWLRAFKLLNYINSQGETIELLVEKSSETST